MWTPICSRWELEAAILNWLVINYPSICPLSPRCGHAFCPSHCENTQAMGYPTRLRDFLKKRDVSDKSVDEGLFVYDF